MSIRCTMPGRFTPPTPDSASPQCAMSALTSVPDGEPGAGCTTMPAGLLTTISVVILEHDVQRHLLGGDMAFDRPAPTVISTSVPGRHPRLGIRDHLAVDRHVARGDQPGEPRARQRRLLWHIARQRLIKARRRCVRRS